MLSCACTSACTDSSMFLSRAKHASACCLLASSLSVSAEATFPCVMNSLIANRRQDRFPCSLTVLPVATRKARKEPPLMEDSRSMSLDICCSDKAKSEMPAVGGSKMCDGQRMRYHSIVGAAGPVQQRCVILYKLEMISKPTNCVSQSHLRQPALHSESCRDGFKGCRMSCELYDHLLPTCSHALYSECCHGFYACRLRCELCDHLMPTCSLCRCEPHLLK